MGFQKNRPAKSIDTKRSHENNVMLCNLTWCLEILLKLQIETKAKNKQYYIYQA